MVQPSNLADVVQKFIDHLALEPEKKFFLEQNDPGESFVSLSGCWYHYGPSCGPYSNNHHDPNLHILSSSYLSNFLIGILLSSELIRSWVSHNSRRTCN